MDPSGPPLMHLSVNQTNFNLQMLMRAKVKYKVKGHLRWSCKITWRYMWSICNLRSNWNLEPCDPNRCRIKFRCQPASFIKCTARNTSNLIYFTNTTSYAGAGTISSAKSFLISAFQMQMQFSDAVLSQNCEKNRSDFWLRVTVGGTGSGQKVRTAQLREQAKFSLRGGPVLPRKKLALSVPLQL